LYVQKDWREVTDMVKRDALAYVYANLPARMPRGSRENIIRASMFHLLRKGLSRDEALRIAMDKARAKGVDVNGLDLRFQRK
jgi:hypothetical protein